MVHNLGGVMGPWIKVPFHTVILSINDGAVPVVSYNVNFSDLAEYIHVCLKVHHIKCVLTN